MLAFLSRSERLQNRMFRGSHTFRSLVPVTAACLLLLLSLPAHAKNTPPPRTEVHAQHFVVLTDAPEKRGREVAVRLEQMRSVFAGLLMRTRLNMSEPVTVLALKDDQKYLSMAPVRNGHPISAPGFLLSEADRAFIVLNVSDAEPWRGIGHDFAHLLLDFNYPPTQPWFDEGLAEYFSSLRLTDTYAQIGGDPTADLSYKEQVYGSGAKPSSTELLNGQAWLPLADLFTMQPVSSAADPAKSAPLFYAESWIVMHYLLNKELLPQAGTYFDLVQNQKLPEGEAIEKAFGMPPAKFEENIKSYFQSLNAAAGQGMAKQFTAPLNPDDIGMSSTEFPDADARALMGDIMARQAEHHDQGVRDLQALTGGSADNAAAHRALAWDYLQKKDFEKATEELGTAAELDQKNPWLRYYLAVLKFRMAQATGQPIQGLANMMQDLKAVLDWYPEFGEAYNMLAMARVEGGGPNSALDAIRAALKLNPRNQQYVCNLGRVYMEGKKFEAARAVFERLKSSGDPEVAAEASSQLAEMGTTQKYGTTRRETPPASSTSAAGLSAPSAASSATNTSPATAGESSHAKQSGSDEKSETKTAAKKPEFPPATGPIEFLKGKVVSVDCSHSPSATVTVVSGKKTLTLHTEDYKSLLVIGADKFACDWSGQPVAINYRASGKTTGDLVSVEVQ